MLVGAVGVGRQPSPRPLIWLGLRWLAALLQQSSCSWVGCVVSKILLWLGWLRPKMMAKSRVFELATGILCRISLDLLRFMLPAGPIGRERAMCGRWSRFGTFKRNLCRALPKRGVRAFRYFCSLSWVSCEPCSIFVVAVGLAASRGVLEAVVVGCRSKLSVF